MNEWLITPHHPSTYPPAVYDDSDTSYDLLWFICIQMNWADVWMGGRVVIEWDM